MKPTIGRIVHFYDEGVKDYPPNYLGPYAAIITFVHSDTLVDVALFPSSVFTARAQVSIELDAGDRGARTWWSWPPRVEEGVTKQTFSIGRVENVPPEEEKRILSAANNRLSDALRPVDPNADAPSNENAI